MLTSTRARRTIAVVAGSLVLSVGTIGCSSVDASTTEPSATPSTTAAPSTDPAAAAKAPRALTATCTASGVTTSSETVRAAAAGVSVTVSSKAPDSVTQLHYVAAASGSDTQFEGDVPLDDAAETVEFAAPPGTLDLTCTDAAGKTVGQAATVAVYDPDGHYRAVDIQKVLGCQPKLVDDGAVTPARSTRDDALARLAAQLGPAGTVEIVPGPGYAESSGSVELVIKRGKGYGMATADLQSNGSWTGRLTAAC